MMSGIKPAINTRLVVHGSAWAPIAAPALIIAARPHMPQVTLFGLVFPLMVFTM